MAIDERIQTMEDEFKLLKGELKQTLANVRDFLVDLNLPAMQEEENLDKQKPDEHLVTVTGAVNQYTGSQPVSPPPAEPKEAPPVYHNDVASVPQSVMAEAGKEPHLPWREYWYPLRFSGETGYKAEEPERFISSDPGTAGKEWQGMARLLPTSQVNPLTNLIRWVSVAKREIGKEQLHAFLDVYRIGGHLPAEVREVILYLAGIIAPRTVLVQEGPGAATAGSADAASLTGADSDRMPATDDKTGAALSPETAGEWSQPCQTDAEVWCRLIMELHGILSSGAVAFTPLVASCRDGHDNRKSPAKSTGARQSMGDKVPGPEMKPAADVESSGFNMPGRNKNKVKRKKPVSKPVLSEEGASARLKLVMRLADNTEKEFSIGGLDIDLKSEEDQDNSVK